MVNSISPFRNVHFYFSRNALDAAAEGEDTSVSQTRTLRQTRLIVDGRQRSGPHGDGSSSRLQILLRTPCEHGYQ
jgi:hypothetical protein